MVKGITNPTKRTNHPRQFGRGLAATGRGQSTFVFWALSLGQYFPFQLFSSQWVNLVVLGHFGLLWVSSIQTVVLVAMAPLVMEKLGLVNPLGFLPKFRKG